MKKRMILTGLCALSIYFTTFGQENKLLTFDFIDFNQKAVVANWLCLYDIFAWWTSDSVMASNPEEINKLGGEWFCFETNDRNWHAVYGKYEDNKMNIVFHYLVDTTYSVSRIYETIDTAFLNTHARALMIAQEQITGIKDSINLRFNQYIKQNEDKTFTVWIFPAFQPNGLAVYGGEFIYKIDKTGTKILEDNSYYQGQFRGFKVDESREIWLNYTELEKPTIGNVFFIWYYKKYFTHINLDNKNHITTAFKDEDENYSWVHVDKRKK